MHVTATGGQVAAALQQSLIRGIQPGGVELTGPTTMPAVNQTIPGVVVSQLGAGASVDADAVSDDTPSVRILVPGDTPAVVSVGAQSEDGASTGTSLEVEIQPGVATEVPLSGIAAGNYTIKMASDQPLVAAAVTTTAGSVSSDFSWSSAAGSLAGDFLVNVAGGPAPVLHLANTSRSDANLTLATDGAPDTQVSVSSGQSVAVPLPAAGSYLVTGGNGIAAAVGYAGDGESASYPVNPIGPLASAIPVYSH